MEAEGASASASPPAQPSRPAARASPPGGASAPPVTSNGAGGSGTNAQFVAGAPEYIPLIDELKRAYKNKILPLEAAYKFEECQWGTSWFLHAGSHAESDKLEKIHRAPTTDFPSLCVLISLFALSCVRCVICSSASSPFAGTDGHWSAGSSLHAPGGIRLFAELNG